MAKATPQLWAQAKALFETGKSLSEISSATGIDRALISRKAKKEGWQKGIYQQLIQDGSRVASELSTLESTVKQVVVEGIDELTKLQIIRLTSDAPHVSEFCNFLVFFMIRISISTYFVNF